LHEIIHFSSSSTDEDDDDVFLFLVPRARSVDRLEPAVLGPDSSLAGAGTFPEDAIEVVTGAGAAATTGSFILGAATFLGVV